jgi:hypothetical protein
VRWSLLLGALCACAEPTTSVPAECNPLGGEHCLAPWPSMAFARRDTEFSMTGFRLAIPSEAMPKNLAGTTIHPAPYNRWDGFSTLGPMFATFSTDIAPASLPADAAESLAATSSIVVLDVARGDRVPVTASLADARTVIVRPVTRLAPGRRYAVAIRDGVRAADGSPLPITGGFAALRDGDDFAHPRFAAVRAGAGDMFAALAAHGIARDELVLAWDFVTASDDFVRGDLVTMRNKALVSIGTAGEFLTYTLAATTAGRFEGTVSSPRFLVTSGRSLHRDEWEWDGRPMLDGTHDARFAVFDPACASSGPRPAIVVGHAMFGSARGAIEDPFVQRIAGEHTGLAGDQRETALAAMTELTQLPVVTENLAQSMIDLLALSALVRGPLARELSIDPANVTYLGAELGGLVGATYLAYENEPVRAAISPSAWPSSELVTTMNAAYPPEVQATNLALLGMAFEPYDPRVTASAIAHDTLAWSAMGEHGALAIAREMGMPVLAPSVMAPWGMTLASEPYSRGLVLFDNATSETPALERQIAQLLARTPLTQQCALDGVPAPCDCASGACD